ncbi:MAG: hypothetical protein NUK65_06010 [Firmicutes bacterium]|nr:hypothetical protein [Bacillota bacterium]
MKKGIATSYFAGANTHQGFQSLFHYIPNDATKRLIILKGGPGTGKSTLMKHLGQKATVEGYDVELFYCSSDNESLDGVSIPTLGLAMTDGTAPHTMDPRVPGAYDEILNLGQCWNATSLQPYKREISELSQQNSAWFTQAYQYLKEAAIVMEKLRWLMAQAMDYQAVTAMTHKLLTELSSALPPASHPPVERQLYGSAITPAGLVNFYPSIFQNIERFYLLSGDPGSGKSYLLERIRETVSRAGHDTEVYRCGFDPARIDAVVVPILKTAFVKFTYPHTFSINPVQVVKEQSTLALSRYAKTARLKQHATERTENTERFWYLLGKAVEMIRASKRNHDKLEEFYVKAMNFTHLSQLRETIITDFFTK